MSEMFTPEDLLQQIRTKLPADEQIVFDDIHGRSPEETLVFKSEKEKEVLKKIVSGIKTYYDNQQKGPLLAEKPSIPHEIAPTHENSTSRMKRLGTWFSRFKRPKDNQKRQ